MAKIVKLSNQSNGGFGLKGVRKTKQKIAEDHGQMNLFEAKAEGRVVNFSSLTHFDAALRYDEAGDLKKAKEMYQSAIGKNQRKADAYCNLGIIEFKQHQNIKAINCFTQAIQQNPRHYQAHYNLGNLYSEEKNYPLAKFHYQVAIELAPDFINAYYNLGLVLAMMKDYQLAVSILTQYRCLAPENDIGNTDDLIEGLKHSITERN